MPPKKDLPSRLTDAELELMQPLWRLGRATVHELLATLPPERPLAYTTVSTILRILEQKQVVRSEKEGRGHVYIPILSREAYQNSTVQQLVTHVFDGAPSALVRCLLENENLSPAELERLRQLLNKEDSHA